MSRGPKPVVERGGEGIGWEEVGRKVGRKEWGRKVGEGEWEGGMTKRAG